MIRKPLDLPPEGAGFINAMNEFFAEPDKHQQDAIAAHSLGMRRQYDKKLGL